MLEGVDIQLLGGQLIAGHGADVVGVQAVFHAQDGVHVVLGVHAGDHLVGLAQQVHLRFGLGALGDKDVLHQRADGLGAMAADKVFHLGDDQVDIGKVLRHDAAAEHIGELEGLAFAD